MKNITLDFKNRSNCTYTWNNKVYHTGTIKDAIMQIKGLLNEYFEYTAPQINFEVMGNQLKMLVYTPWKEIVIIINID